MGSAGALALLAGLLLLRRREPPDKAAADSTTQIAALESAARLGAGRQRRG